MAIKTHIINPNPRLTSYLVKDGVFLNSPLMVIDVGARGGFEAQWDLYGEQVVLTGFEVDPMECERLNSESIKNRKYYPIALSDKKELRDFNVQSHISSSSFYRSDSDFLHRFADGWEKLIPTSVQKVTTTDLDSFVVENQIPAVDFIKLDAEGAELDIFRGATNTLKTVIGLSTEAVFVPWRKHMPTFSEIDIFLRKKDFTLYDLPVFRWARRTLSPQMFSNRVPGPVPNGQAIWTQAIYFKDVLSQVEIKNWDIIKVLKQASIMELYNLQDCAMELVQFAYDHGLLSLRERDLFTDLLVPPLNGQIVTYKYYKNYLKREQNNNR